MTSEMKILCCGVVLFVLLLTSYIEAVVETNDLITGGRCGATSRVSGGLVFSHQPFDTLPPITNNIVCFFTMQGIRFRHKIRFMFSHFSLSPSDCSLANLTFFEGTSDTDPVIATICPDTPDVLTREYVTDSFFLTLKLQVSSFSAEIRSANFSGYYVSYTDDRDPCVDPSLEMMCDNGRCVYEELQCDDIDSCGDNTDERTSAPSFCNETTTTRPDERTAATTDPPTTPATQATTQATMGTPATTLTTSPTTMPAISVDNSLFVDLTPLYIILSLTFVTFSVYLIYILLSFPCFKECMTGCLRHCFLIALRRRRKWKEADEAAKKNLSRRVAPVNHNDMMTLENLSAVELPRDGTDSADSAISSMSSTANA